MNILLKEKMGNESFVMALIPPNNSSKQCSSLEVEEQTLSKDTVLTRGPLPSR